MRLKPLSVADLIRAGQFDDAVDRMQELCRIQDPEVPVDVDAVRSEYWERRNRLAAVVPPAPIRVVVVDSAGQIVKRYTRKRG